MRRIGRVVALDGSRATVCFDPGEACKKCEAGPVCHAASAKRTVIVENTVNAWIGDDVSVKQSPGKALLSAFILFGLPVILAVLGLIIGTRWGETWSVICGVAGFVLGLIIAKFINNRLARNSLFLPRITEVLKKEGS
jgi:positive regulator of sigma E activity